MNRLVSAFDTPWKIFNEFSRWLSYPITRIIFAINRIPWGTGWGFYGVPIIQKHRQSQMTFGPNLQLRSTLRSNPLAPNHPVFLTTWEHGACLTIGDSFAMTGGIICAAESITIGNNVALGANSTIVDTDFHPVDDPLARKIESSGGKTAPVVIEDDVFIGMNCLILKGVTIGRGSVIGAGSVVAGNIPSHVIAAGNPARVIREL